MSFNQNVNGRGYAPGWILAEADCSRETAEISASHAQAVTIGDKKIVPMGAVIPSNNSAAKGILYEDVEVTTGDMPGSIITRGKIYGDRLPADLDSDAASALTGITVVTAAPTVTRPTSFNKTELDAITVTSTEGTGSGKTDVAVSGYTLGAGESYLYKIGAAAESVALGEILPVGSGKWTAGTFPLDELTATDGQKITVAAVDATGAAVAAGNATIDSKA